VNKGRQLTTFNHQGWVTIGGKKDPSGRLARAFQGTVAGKQATQIRIFIRCCNA
jgi:hypothetical protein